MRLLDKIDAGFLPLPEFVRAVGALPLVSVDWVLLNPSGQMLLGKRRNAPARHWWFTPGGRVRKNEPLGSCLQRVAVSELGLQASDVQGARLMGVWDHFYEDSAFSGKVSTHYVNLPHVLCLPHTLDLKALPLDQHIAWRWQDVQAAALANDVHSYVRLYAQWVLQQEIITAPNHPESTAPPAD
jgi:colanic acid biosynthesis protein WcaH